MSATLSGMVLRTFHGPVIAEERIYVFTMCLLIRNRTITGISPVYGAEMAKTHERARATAVTQMVGVQHSFGMPLIESYSDGGLGFLWYIVTKIYKRTLTTLLKLPIGLVTARNS